MDENDINNILWDKNPRNPFFDLEIIEIPKDNFDPKTPASIVKNDLKNLEKHFIFGHLNSRSVNKNIIEMREFLEQVNLFDAFSVSESWLRSRTPKDRFEIPGFNIFRTDRRNKRGGGVCCYVRDHYIAKKLKVPNVPDSPELLFVEVSVLHQKVCLGTFYKAPKIPARLFHDVFDSLGYIFHKYEEPILTGDFNVNVLNKNSPEYRHLCDSIIDPFNLTQIIDQPTRVTESSQTLIDLMLVKNRDKVKAHGCCAVPGVSDHHVIYMAYDIKKPHFKPIQVTTRDFKNFDIEGFLAAAELAHFENVYFVGTVDEKVTVLENTIKDLLDRFAPYKTFTITKQNSTPWLTDEIRKVMNVRDMYKYNYNATKNKHFEHKFKELRNKVTGMMRQSQKEMFNDTINTKVKDCKHFYKTAKKLNIISDKSSRTKINFSAQDLNETFLKNNNAIIDPVFINDRLQELHNKTNGCIHKFELHEVTEPDVIKVSKSIKSMSVGVDGLNIFVIKTLMGRISSILTHIINVSFEHSIFPERWKKAIIKPIPKVPVPITPSDYRPISILPALSKIIEKLVNIQIVSYLTMHSLLDPYQSAYKKNHSTQTALLKLTEDIYDCIDDSEITLLVLLDFSKAFDTVNHKLLLAKLKILGFQDRTCDWISSYLTGRSQRVETENESSEWADILNGVPQGSILGPLLFTILISDMRVTIWNGSYITYADDTNLYWESDIENVNDTLKTAGDVLSKVAKYCSDNCLRLSEGKCKYIFLGTRPGIKKLNTMNLIDLPINNIPLERVSDAKVLGVNINEVLSWVKQVNSLISKAMSNFFQMSRYKRFLNKQAKITLCESIVLSQFNYCDIVYSNMDIYLKNKIQKVQNWCVKFIFNLGRKDHCDYDLLRKELNWLDMNQRRVKHGLTLIYKILHGLAPNYLLDSFTLVNQIHNVNTRRANSCIYINKNISSKIHRKAYTFEMSQIYNNIPEDIRQSKSVDIFKNKIGDLLLKGNLTIPL